MAEVILNDKLSSDFFILKAAWGGGALPGQFYMLRAWDKYPLLSRPISVFDADEQSVTFLYKVVGEGTKIFARLAPGDDITLHGPYGSSFPQATGKIALVGGGCGMAPLYFAAKMIKKQSPGARVDIYLGFSGTPFLTDEYGGVADNLTVNVGGFITDDINPQDYDKIFTCGPEAMMKVLYNKCVAQGVSDRLIISVENRMACGVGACLVCSCKTISGNKKACKDGPVFSAEEVFGI